MEYIVATWWIAVCIYFEARGESITVQHGVAHVILNRAYERSMSVVDVIHEDRQFSWYTHGMEIRIKDTKAFETCLLSARQCLTQRMEGNIFGGANHFHDMSIEPPYWAEKMVYLGQFGNMKFYKG